MFKLLSQQFPAHDFALLGLVLALPLVSALINGVFGKRLGKDGVRSMTLWTMALAFLVSVRPLAFKLHRKVRRKERYAVPSCAHAEE